MPQKDFTSVMKKIKDNLIKTRTKYKKTTEKMLDDSWALFDGGCMAIFQKHKRLDSFSWMQFTPYWDEVDDCTFCAYVDEPHINEMDFYEVCENDEELARAADDIVDFLTLFHDEILKKMFGDHIVVKVTKEGICLEEHEENKEDDEESDQQDGDYEEN